MIAGYGLFPPLFNLVFIKEGDIEKDERHESIFFHIYKKSDEALVEIENVRKLKAILYILLGCLVLMIYCYF